MGLYLSLNVSPSIDSNQWSRFWHESLQLLQKFPLRLVRPAKHKTPHGAQKVWSDKLTDADKHGEYWEIAGDTESLLFGEPVRIYRDFEYYRKKWNSSKHDDDRNNTDPLFCTLHDFEQENGLVSLEGIQLFNARTQGYPYHHALAAVALLAEFRFSSAFTWGDLGSEGGEAIRQWLSVLYDEDKMPLPICLDAARLWNRIEGACGEILTTMNRFEERFLGPSSRKIHRMLAESRETTMRKMAEDFLQFDTVTLGFKDISKSFLEATDDLELFLDLIHLRNSLIQNEKSQEKKQRDVPLEKVLAMLVKSFVCYSQWQGEELQTLRRWIESEGNVVQMINSALLKAGLLDFFDFYCSENDLLEIFSRREPGKRDLFEQVIRKNSVDNVESLEEITELVRMIKNKAVEKLGEETEEEIEPEDYFTDFMEGEAYMQSELREPLSEENVAAIGRYFGYHIANMREIVSDFPEGAYMNDPTGSLQRDVFLSIAQHCDIRLLEEAVLEIERTDDVELLNLFAPLCPFLFNSTFRMQGAILLGEGFEMSVPMLWHLFNKPIWWKTFCEHRNDGFMEDES